MRYNRITHEAELTVSDLCGYKQTDDHMEQLAIASGFIRDSGAEQNAVTLKQEFEGIVYSVNVDFYVRDGATVCEFLAETDGKDDRKRPTIKPETAIAAYSLSRAINAEYIDIETVIVNSETVEYHTVDRKKTAKALEAYFMRRLVGLAPMAEMLKERGERILPESAQVKFPYPKLRKGQKLMMSECYSAISGERRLFVQAPTGIGKTVSALYPAIKALGQGRCDKIFYLTARGSTQREVFKTAGALFDSGAHLRTVIISAKDHICSAKDNLHNGMCDSRECLYSGAPEEKFVGAVNTLLALQNGYEYGVIEKIATEWGVCPYELSLRLAEYCEIIIADYNYVFDPLVSLRRFFGDKSRTDKYVFLIDEAHNLADRTRDMYSAELSTVTFSRLKAHLNEIAPKLAGEVEDVMHEMRGLRELCADSITRDEATGVEFGYYLSRERYERLDISLERLCEDITKYINRKDSAAYRELLAPIYREIKRYLVVSELCEGNSVFYCETVGTEVSCRSLCVDPSNVVDMRMGRACSAILFSATLTPLDYFMDILGGNSRSDSLAIKSPFDDANLFIATVDDVSTRYEDREKSLARVASYIAATVSCRRGNYMVYFSSYDYMRKAADAFGRKYPKVRLMVQERRMGREAKERYLDEFRLNDGIMRVGFCVLGGGFSEGIDLPGSNLIGVVVVGVGMPGLSSERNIMRDHYDMTRESGYDYAYTFPGMNNVLQAVGRVIRSDTDRGVAVLIDDRYTTPKYREMYPENWQKMKHFCQPVSLNDEIKAFWDKKS